MKMEKTREPQYQELVRQRAARGLETLGVVGSFVWNDDPRRLPIFLSRYKFVSKMLSGLNNVLEVGCGDGMGARLVLQEVEKLTAADFDPIFVEDAKKRMNKRWEFKCIVHDFLSGPVEGKFDGAYSLDVLEHIPAEKELLFLSNITRSLDKNGVLVVGTPSLASQKHASRQSKQGHVNCKDHRQLKKLLSRFFHNVFIFSMNDEVVHTGFYPMAHYLIALCCSKKRL